MEKDIDGRSSLNSDTLLTRLSKVLSGDVASSGEGNLYVGVDLGTANIVVVVVDEMGQPVAGALQPARVVRDGLVVEYMEAIRIVQRMVNGLEDRLGLSLSRASTGIPPGTSAADARGVVNVVQAVGLTVTNVVDEPSAAAIALGITHGVVVDVGGGTTGVSILENGQVVYTADEPTGGTHFTLVLAGHFGIDFDQAEALKKDPRHQAELKPVVLPCMEKVAAIVARHISGYAVDKIYLAGGTCAFPGMATVMKNSLGIPTVESAYPLLVTPLGLALCGRK